MEPGARRCGAGEGSEPRKGPLGRQGTRMERDSGASGRGRGPAQSVGAAAGRAGRAGTVTAALSVHPRVAPQGLVPAFPPPGAVSWAPAERRGRDKAEAGSSAGFPFPGAAAERTVSAPPDPQGVFCPHGSLCSSLRSQPLGCFSVPGSGPSG